MNADVRPLSADLRPRRLTVPAAAWARLQLGLAQANVAQTAFAYGVPPHSLGDLVDYWLHDFDLEPQLSLDGPSFARSDGAATLYFTHQRASAAGAMPLLLLHGYAGSPAEFRQLRPSLAAFHGVSPWLPGFGPSSPLPSSHAIAKACASLMQQLGYARYLVHGVDLGATLALELAALDPEHVAGLHVTSLPAYPQEDPFELATLTREEKSRLAQLSHFREQLDFLLPTSPLEAAAFALAAFEEPVVSPKPSWLDPLLTGLSVAWALGDGAARSRWMQERRLARAPASTRPLAVHSFPLDAPSLQRFAEQQHRIAVWHEANCGGCMPALEQPETLSQSLHDFFGRFA